MKLIDANNLFLRGQIALAEVESNGIKIDTDFLDKSILKVKKRISNLQEKMKEDPVWKIWKKRYGLQANLGSRPQLSKVLFDEMGIKSVAKTRTGRYATDETVLSQIDLQFVRDFLKVEGLKKLKTTYLVRLRDETVDGYYHPEHHLNTVTTYRSSADGIQTIPTRDEWAKKVIRSCFIPRPNHALVAVDFAAHEFRVFASVYKDPAMMVYASDSTKDIHRDIAARMFRCKKDQVTSELRYISKNGFVFPRLYGSYYVNIALSVWSELVGKTIDKDGTQIPVIEWLALNGIRDRGVCDHEQRPEKGTFEHLMLDVQEWMDKKFKVFATTREEAYHKYRDRGWFKQVTGFVERGLYSKKDVQNHRVQGPAFHCLLWTMINTLKQIKKRKMRAKILAEIHDEILADVPLDEVQTYLNMVKDIVGSIQKEWKWILVPLSIEAKMSTSNWHEMKTVVEKEGVWQ